MPVVIVCFTRAIVRQDWRPQDAGCVTRCSTWAGWTSGRRPNSLRCRFGPGDCSGHSFRRVGDTRRSVEEFSLNPVEATTNALACQRLVGVPGPVSRPRRSTSFWMRRSARISVPASTCCRSRPRRCASAPAPRHCWPTTSPTCTASKPADVLPVAAPASVALGREGRGCWAVRVRPG